MAFKMVISFTQFETFPAIDVAVAVACATTNCCFVRLLCYVVLCYTHFLQMFCILFHCCVIRECFISVRNLCVLDAGMLDRLPIPAGTARMVCRVVSVRLSVCPVAAAEEQL